MDNICDIAVIKKVVDLINFLLNIDRFSIDKSPPFLKKKILRYVSCNHVNLNLTQPVNNFIYAGISNQLNILFSLSMLKCSIHTTY